MSGARAAYRYRPAVQLGQSLDHRKADAESLVGPMRAVLLLAEYVEHEGQEFGLDALSGIRNYDPRIVRLPIERNTDAAAGRRELHRVRNDVLKHLQQPAGIALDRQG